MASIEKDFVDVRRKSNSFVVAGTHSFTVPDDVYVSWATAVAGGGGGGGSKGSSSNPGYAGAGGGASGMSCVRYPIFVTPGETLTLVVGVGGLGGYPENHGLNGGATTVSGGLFSLYLGGGSGGSWGGAHGNAWVPYAREHYRHVIPGGPGGDGAADSQVATKGWNNEFRTGGSVEVTHNYSRRPGGGGASSHFANGGAGGTLNIKTGKPAGGFGAGGGGAFRDGVGHQGGDGGGGFILLEY